MRLGRGVPDRGQADPAVLGEAADHVEHDPDLPRLVEVQPVSGHDVEQVGQRQPAQQPGLEMVGGDQVLLVPAGCQEQRGRRVVAAVGEELQGEERVGGPALAQVELDGVRRPRAVGAADHDEVDREPAERALVGQPPPDRLGVLGDGARRTPGAAGNMQPR